MAPGKWLHEFLRREHWEEQAWEDDEEQGPKSTWNEAMGSGSAGTDDKQTRLLQS